MSSPNPTHRLEALFDRPDDAVLTVTFSDGMILKLRAAQPVDVSIYEQIGRWSAIVVQCVAGRRFTVGSGVDFVEDDVAAVVDDATGQALYP